MVSVTCSFPEGCLSNTCCVLGTIPSLWVSPRRWFTSYQPLTTQGVLRLTLELVNLCLYGIGEVLLKPEWAVWGKDQSRKVSRPRQHQRMHRGHSVPMLPEDEGGRSEKWRSLGGQCQKTKPNLAYIK